MVLVNLFKRIFINPHSFFGRSLWYVTLGNHSILQGLTQQCPLFDLPEPNDYDSGSNVLIKAHYCIHSTFRLHLMLHNLHHQSSVGLGLMYCVTSLGKAWCSLWYEGFGRSGWFLWGFWCAQGSVSQERNWDAERAGVEHALSCSRITTQTDAPLCKTYSSPVLCALLRH